MYTITLATFSGIHKQISTKDKTIALSFFNDFVGAIYTSKVTMTDDMTGITLYEWTAKDKYTLIEGAGV